MECRTIAFPMIQAVIVLCSIILIPCEKRYDFRMSTAVKHISLDSAADSVKQFVRELQSQAGEAVLELEGKPLLRVRAVRAVDPDRLREAIIARRDESRELNQAWHVASHLADG